MNCGEIIMFEKISNLKNKKGFTLVELIVVLVILAILAALLIPALTGYIDKANKEKVVAETRMIVMAVQTEASTYYGTEGSTGAIAADSTIANKAGAANSAEKTRYDEIVKLAEVKGLTDTPTASFQAEVGTNGAVKSVSYENGTYTCVYTASSSTYKVEKPDTAPADYAGTVVVK